MKRIAPFTILSILLAFALPSCELVTENPPEPILKPANHFVINEVFTLPKTHQRAFSWIEMYNPTRDTIDLDEWAIAFRSTGQLTRYAVDSLGRPIFASIVVLRQGEGEWEIPFKAVEQGRKVFPFEFATITNNEERLLSYTDYGLGLGPKLEASRTFVWEQFFENPDTTRPDTVLQLALDFQLETTDQILLKRYTQQNPQGEVIDVVRYGNYVYTGGADPYPNCRSIGVIPEFQSIARYNGAYDTGNTAEDFYRTGIDVPGTRPIPHWLSQAYKQ